jgi:hypothetical protein
MNDLQQYAAKWYQARAEPQVGSIGRFRIAPGTNLHTRRSAAHCGEYC